MEKNIAKILFITGWVVIFGGIISNIDSTLYLHASQYVPEGENPDPLRVTRFIGDILFPLKDGGILIALSYILKYFQRKEEKSA